jgi:hypothetical protein
VKCRRRCCRSGQLLAKVTIIGTFSSQDGKDDNDTTDKVCQYG